MKNTLTLFAAQLLAPLSALQAAETKAAGQLIERPAFHFTPPSVAPASHKFQADHGVIRGVVTDRAGNVFLEGATVTLIGSPRTFVTDRRGEFEVTRLAPGTTAFQHR
jgi:hypothetical protein